MKKALIVLSFSSALIVVAGITYFLTFQLPNKQRAELYLKQEQAELEKERLQVQEAKDKESKLDNCLEDSQQRHRDRWKKNCEIQNEKIDEEGNCPLPSDLVRHLDEEYKNFREECLKRYS